MNAIEILALIFGVAIILKMIAFAISPKFLLSRAKTLIKHSRLVNSVFVVLAVIFGYYLLQYFSIVDIAAVSMFVFLLMGITLYVYPRQMLGMANVMVKGGMRRAWFPVLIWSLLALWVLYELFL